MLLRNIPFFKKHRSPKSISRRKPLRCFESLETRTLLTGNPIDIPQSDIVLASDPASNDQFGFSTAITNDGKIAVIGANKDDQLGSDSGAAYVMHFDGNQWNEVSKITSPTPSANGQFGSGVAIVGTEFDYTIVVGTETPRAFVFEGSNGSVELAATLTTPAAKDSFGQRNSVSVSRLTTTGGVTELIVVGDSNSDAAQRKAGAAYVFRSSSNTWKVNGQSATTYPIQTLTKPSARRNEDFGRSVAISGDGKTIAVGDHAKGEVHIYEDNSGNFTHQAALSSTGGWDVDLSRDGRVLASSTMWDSYVVERNTANWSQFAGSPQQLPETYVNSANEGNARFGWTLDVNEDGDTIVVGAASNPENTGFAFIKGEQDFVEHARFGREIVTDGNLAAAASNGEVALFGNQWYDASTTSNSGAAHVFAIPPVTAVPGITILADPNLETDEGGGTTSFDLRLNTQPAADVTIALSSSDESEGTVTPLAVTFTTADWNLPKTIVVTGADDSVLDGNIVYTISSTASSLDLDYDGATGSDVTVTNMDDEVPSTRTIRVGDLDAMTTSARGRKWNATVAITVIDLDDVPVSNATVSGTWSDGGSGSASCTTDINGICSVTKNNLKSNVSGITFTVDAIAGANLVYDSGQNFDPDGDSDGTVIRLTKPGLADVAAAIESLDDVDPNE